MTDTVFRTGTLWESLVHRTETAIAAGALHTIETRRTIIDDGGMAFSVRIAANLRRKAADRVEQAKRAQHTGRPVDPFLPPEQELTVGNISTTHRAVLNKFNVVEHHLLIVTRDFEEQEQTLTAADFEALWTAMREYPALGFYNGGTVAGASQRHKHLQMIPLPLFGEGPALPVDPLLGSVGDAPSVAPRLPFRHRVARIDPGLWRLPARAARVTQCLYREMLEQLHLPPVAKRGSEFQSGPYNFLVTRDWMMLVPRAREHWEAISINAMGFAGSLFVRDEAQLQRVREVGPMRILAAVA